MKKNEALRISSPIDPAARAVIEELQVEGQPSLFGSIVDLYLQTSDELLTKLRAPGSSSESLCEAAHSWKSSSLSVGATELGRLCMELETCAKSNVPGLHHVVEKIVVEYEMVRKELESIRKSL